MGKGALIGTVCAVAATVAMPDSRQRLRDIFHL
jgi:hypothetical protein